VLASQVELVRSRATAVLVSMVGAMLLAAAQAAEDPGRARAELVEEAVEALRSWRTEDARRGADQLLRADPAGPLGHQLGARVAFMEGDYTACRRHLAALEERGAARPEEIAAIVAQLQPVHESFRERTSEHFRLRWSHPADEVLAEYAFGVLENALAALRATLRYRGPDSKIIVEIYPDIESFAAASTLSEEDIRTSGAVAICKFNRLMLASPRLYLQGYRWCDTLAHELTHYVIVKKTGNRVGVWLHEGIAKWCEELWRRDGQEVALSPLHSTFLAEARESGSLIGFDRMHPSLAKLGSREATELAFAEVVSFVQFLRERAGREAIPELLERVASGQEPQEALEGLTGSPFELTVQQWKEWLGSRELERIPGLRVLPRKLREGGDNSEGLGDLSGELPEEAFRFVRLGEMLDEEARPAAAAIEYRKAVRTAGFVSPQVHVRLARAEIKSGSLREAARTLEQVARYYEDYLPLHIARAELHLRRGDHASARAAMEEAVQINPFDPRPHEMLIALYAESGREAELAREGRVLRTIREWLQR